MFTFIPQLVIILAVFGIIVVVLRKVPGVGEFVEKTPLMKKPWHAGKFLAGRLWAVIVVYSKKLWQFVLEVKQISKTRGLPRFPNHLPHLPAGFPKLRFPAGKLTGIFKHADTPEFFLREAEASFAREDYPEAERQFIKVIEKDPHSEEAYVGLGKLYLAQKKFEDAIETYKYLVKHHAENDGYYASLGQAYHGQKLYDPAVEAYERAIELVPDNPKRYFNLGLTLEAKKHLEEAILNYRKAIELDKSNTQFLMGLADALIKKEEKEQAELILEQIMQLQPTNHLAREKLMQLKF